MTQIIGFRLAPDEKQLAAIPTAGRRHPMPGTNAGTTRNLSAESILARNAFDSVTGPLNAGTLDVTLPTPGSLAVDDRDPMHAPDCEGLKVIVIAASTDPDWSFASFTPTTGASDAKPMLRRRGGDVSGKTVTSSAGIGCGSRTGRSSASSKCSSRPRRPVRPLPRSRPTRKGGGADDLTKEISKGIQKVGPTEYKIERGVVDKILENTAALMTQVRIVPEKDGDKSTGIRLFGVKPDSLLGVLGMENGDKLQTINGFDMTNPEKALEAYARLRTADHLTVAVNRKGAATNLDYNIQ